MANHSAWLEQCQFYRYFKKEIDFITPNDDGQFEIALFVGKAAVLSPILAVTMQATAVELLLRTTLGWPNYD